MNMQFCIISPAAGLQQWATKSRAHLVLSQVTNAVYQQFYRRRSESGDLLILDNGAYENKLDSKQLLERIGLYHPKVVVLPDLLGAEASDSFAISKDFHDKWKSAIPFVQWMYVPQGENVHDFEYGLNKGIDTIRPEWVALPRILGTDLDPGRGTRAKWAQYIYNKWPHINVHCLGMLAGDIQELSLLEEANVTSIDSSAPVWRGWNGFDIEDARWETRGTECNFDAYPFSDKHRIMTIENNLAKCGVGVNVI